jgi:hypothetical protein
MELIIFVEKAPLFNKSSEMISSSTSLSLFAKTLEHSL